MQIEAARPPISSDIVSRRLERTATLLAAHGADALLVFRASNILGFCGVPLAPSDRHVCGLINRDRQIAFVLPAFEAEIADSLPPGSHLVCWQEHEDPFAATAEAARLLGVDRGLILLDGHTWMETRERLRQAMPSASMGMDTGLIAAVRIRKSAEEVDAIRAACADAARIYPLVSRALRPGLSERELARDVIAALSAKGVRPFGELIQGGENAAVPHGQANTRRFVTGDAVVVDFVAVRDGYFGDMTRTYAVGRCDEDVRSAYAVVRQAQRAAIEYIRPGVSCESVDAVARRVIDDAGLGAWFTHRLGHGIGLDVHEPPYLVRGSRQVLEPGMCVTVEPGVYVPGRFGIRIEDTVAVTADGCSVLSSQIPTDVSDFS